MRLERRAHVSLHLTALAPLTAIAVALVISGALISAAGVNPFAAYAEMLKGAFGSRLSITETLTRATPLTLTGLAAAARGSSMSARWPPPGSATACSPASPRPSPSPS